METSESLNVNTLIGFTEKRGRAWHYRAEEQGEESNHYPGAVPVEDVKRRLFPWQALSESVYVGRDVPKGETALRANASHIQGGFGYFLVPNTQAIIRSDTGAVFGIPKAGYQIHQYSDWLMDKIAVLLDSDLSIGSAGVLKGGAIAWVQIELPENVSTPEGVDFRPTILASTSHDGTLATAIQRATTIVVCDNTMQIARREGHDQKIKVKHSKNSLPKLQAARDALGIIYQEADDVAAEIRRLTQLTVTDKQWADFLDAYIPLPEEEGRGRTRAENKRDAFTRLWDVDMRVSPWRNTAYGVVAAANTHLHHESIIHGDDRAGRNVLRATTGKTGEFDDNTLLVLDRVLSK